VDFLKYDMCKYQYPNGSTSASTDKITPFFRFINKVNNPTLVSQVSAASHIVATINDVDRYFNTALVEVDRDNEESSQDPQWVINYWIAQEKAYPIMARVARDILSIVAAEVDVERIFSTGRDIVGIRRQSLHGETIQMLSMLKNHAK